jgi:hypothetical protein
MTLVRNSITNNYTNSTYNLAKQYGETTGDTPQDLIEAPPPKRRPPGVAKLRRKFHQGPGAHFDPNPRLHHERRA